MTSLKDQEAAIVADLTTIRELWDHMLPTMKAIPLGQLGGGSSRSSTSKAEDNGDHNADVTNLDIVLSDRGDITAVLQGWARVVVEDFDVTTVIPHGHDVGGMCTFLERWARHMTGHVAADDFAAELHVAAGKVLRRAVPKRRDWMLIGDCPIEIEHEDGSLAKCGGRVVAYLFNAASRDPRCQKCGTEAVVDWWISHMFDNPEAKVLVTASELISVIAFRLHWTVTHEQIRQWAARGKIERAGKDSKGRTLYDHSGVIYAISSDVRAQREKAGA
jgi:hypothetical protein